MNHQSSSPRILLRRLRELMAEPLEPQERLDRIVGQIADNMVAAVCSVYVLRADSILELYATQGLKRDAVHLAQLRMGQGLVGSIASSSRLLNLSDAQSHPAFRYLPETGEEIYHSFLGVPILRAGRTLGVLVVQNIDEHSYSEEDAEALQTAAMLLAELIASGDLKKITRPGMELDLTRSISLSGDPYGEGIALGHVVLHEPRVIINNLVNEDSDAEIARLRAALENLRSSIDELLKRGDVSSEGEHREVLETYRMFAHDRGWVRRLEEAIMLGLTAEGAVEKVQSDTKARMIRLTDPFMRDRMHDLDDLANRLLRQLTGHLVDVGGDGFPDDAIVVARVMGAAELLDYPRESLRGLVLEEGAATSHVIIVARAMGIPVIGQATGVAAQLENGDSIIVDGEDGEVHIRPIEALVLAYEEKIRLRAHRQEQFRALRDVEPVSADGVAVSLMMNAGLLVDLPQLDDSGAEGIGLFRTELQFMISSRMPRAVEQENFYRQVLDRAGNRPVTFRTLDIGSDKVVSFFRAQDEENPAMGWRAIRLALDRPYLLRMQLRALMKACAGETLKVMVPMVSEVGEIRETRALLAKEVQHLTRFGHQVPRKVELGAMLEVPALLYEIDELMAEVDFISVGSNDLYQFLMAIDRGNARVSHRYDTISKPFLRVLRDIVRAGERNGVPVTLCGEYASKPLSAMALFAIGYRAVSMSATAIGPVKAMLLGLNIEAISEELNASLDDPSNKTSVRVLLERFASDNNIPL